MRPLNAIPPCEQITRRRTANVRLIGGLTVPAVVLGAVLTASPAFAADTVNTKAELKTAFGNATSDGGTITLGDDLAGSSSVGDLQNLPDDAKLTIDLAGHELDLDQIVLGDGSTLTVTDSGPTQPSQTTTQNGLDVGAKATPSASGATGIALGSKANLVIAGDAHVTSTGSASKPGIGVVAEHPGAQVHVQGSAVVVAKGGSGAAGIGGGDGLAGVDVTLAGSSTTTATGPAGTIGAGANGGDSGTLSITDTAKLVVPEGQSLQVSGDRTIANAGTIQLDGSLGGAGSVQNDGTILQGTKSAIDKNTAITGNDYVVTYDKGDGVDGPVPADARVLAPTLGSVDLDPNAVKVTKTGAHQDGWEGIGTDTDTDTIPVVATTKLSRVADANGAVVLTPVFRDDITVSGNALGVATVGHAYSDSVAASGYDITNYALDSKTPLPEGLELDSKTGAITGTPAEGTDGDVTITVIVTSKFDEQQQEYKLSVGKETTVTAGSLPAAKQGSPYTGQITADGTGTFTYTVTKGDLPAGVKLDKATGKLTGTPTTPGTTTFTVKATADGKYAGAAEGKDAAEFSITVQSIPVFATKTLKSAAIGTDFVGKVKATDVDSDSADESVTYAIKDQGTLPGTFSLSPDGTLSGRAAVAGDWKFTVEATGVHGSSTQEYSFNVGAVPVITTDADLGEVTVGDATYSKQISASGRGVDYSSKNLPAGLHLDETSGVLTGTPDVSSTKEPKGVFTFTVTADNEFGSVDRTFTLKSGTKPVLSTVALPDVGVDQPYHGGVAFTSEDDATVSVTGLPEGLSYDAKVGEIVGQTNKNGTFKVTISVRNHWGTTSSKALDLVVGTAPSGFVSELPVPIIGQEYSAKLGALGEGEVTYTFDGDLPAGLELEGDTITGTPTEAGTYEFEVTAASKYGKTSKTYTLTSGAAPQLAAEISLPKGFVGQGYAGYDLDLKSGDGTAKFSVTKGDLPAGLSLSADGALSGTPTGTGSTFTVTAETPFGSASRILTISVKKPASFDTTTLKVITLENGRGTVEQLIDVSGDGDSIAVHPDGDLPAGLSFDKGRDALYGTVTKPGLYKIHLVAEGLGAPTEHVYDLLVGNAPKIAQPALADGTVGEQYSVALQLADDQGTPKTATTWTVEGLPAGLTFDAATGAISGEPTAAGSSSLTATVKNAFGTDSVQKVALKVAKKAVVVPVTPEPVKTTAPEPVKTTAPEPAKTTAPAASTPAPVKSTAPVVTTPAPAVTTPAPVATTPAPAPVPVLPTVPTMTVKYGHEVSVSVAANSATVVTYAIAEGSLPKGLSLDAKTGVISGTPKQEGAFAVTVKATNAAGSSLTKLSFVIPKIQELVKATPATVTAGIGKTVAVKVAGLKKGESYTVSVDGKVKQRGKAASAGTLALSVKLPRSLTDKAHTIKVAGSRTVADPAQRASTTVTVTSITQRKSLSVKATATTGTVKRLAAGEKVVVTTADKTVVARGKADAKGVFTFSTKSVKKGTKLTAHGATAKRAGSAKKG